MSKGEKLLATGMFDSPPFADTRDFTWSPDSRFIAYLTAGAKTFQNVHVGAGCRRRKRAPVSFLANTNAGSLSWSPDGTYLTFATSQRTEPGDVVRVDLLPRTPKFREDQFRDLFREEQPKTPAPTPATAPPAQPRPPPPPGGGRLEPRPQARGDRLRRHPPPRRALPVGVDVVASGDQPRRQMAAADGERRRPAEPVRAFRSTSSRRSRPSRGS